MRIEPALLKDEEAVWRLTCELEEEALPREAFGEAYRFLLSAPGEHVFLLLDGEALGYVHLRIAPQLHHASLIAEIQELVIAPSCRGRGMGRALLTHALSFARERGACMAELTSNFTREGAHRFYEREGFRRSSYKFIRAL